jgi:hypothetical protein
VARGGDRARRRRLLTTQPLLDRERGVRLVARPRRLAQADEAELAQPVAQAKGLEDPEGAVLDHVGDGAAAIEQAKHRVDRIRDGSRQAGDLLLVALVDRRRGELAGDRAHLGEELLRVGEELVRLERDLAAAHHVLRPELEAAFGPQQELVEGGEPVQQPGLGRGDLALEEADLASAHAANQGEDPVAPDRADGADQEVEAEVLAEVAGEDRRVVLLPPRQQPGDGHRIAHVGRLAEELAGALVEGLRPRDAVADVEDRQIAPAPAQGAAHLGQDRAGFVAIATSGDDELGRLVERRRVELLARRHRRHRHSLSFEPEPERFAETKVRVDKNQSRNH